MLYKIGAAAGNLSQEITSGAVKSNYRFKNKLINASARNTTRLHRPHRLCAAEYRREKRHLSAYDAALAQLVANNVANAATVQANTVHTGLKIDFYNLGYVYDRNEWLLEAEYGARRIDKDSIVDMDGFWLLAGYRIGKWTPYLSWTTWRTRVRSASRQSIPHRSAPTARPPRPIATSANNFMQRFDRTNVGAGIRWDILDNVALKAQVERIDKGPGGTAYFVNGSSEFFANQRKVNVYSATLDFVF